MGNEGKDRLNTDGKKVQIGSILDNLMHSSRFRKEEKEREVPHGPQLTSLGIPLIEERDGEYLIDMTAMRVFSGIPGFVSSVAKQVLENCRNSPVDILTRTMVDAENTPELAALGVGHVIIYSRGSVARLLLKDQEAFTNHLRLVFDAVQTPRWGGLLFPGAFETGSTPFRGSEIQEGPAMLFPFHSSGERACGYFMLLEYDRPGRFLRLTVEDGSQSRLFLKRIPHRVVNEPGRRHYRQDIAIMAEQIFTGIHRECMNQHNEYMEIPGRQAALFELLIASELEDVTGSVFRWTQETSEKVLLSRDSAFTLLLSKILLLLEDEGIVRILASGSTLEMIDDKERVYMDLSRKGSMLNISIGEPRKKPDMDAHLRRMPRLLTTLENMGSGMLEKYRILFIHHTTSEVLGFIKALDQSGIGFLSTLFIRYQGIVPDFYLEDMLSMPEDRFRFSSLERIELRDSVEGAYILSRRYSSLEGLKDLDKALRQLRASYEDAMRFTAGHLFFREAFAAMKEGRKLLLIEDGGYLAPVLNRFCSESRSLAYALQHFAVKETSGLEADLPLKEWLGPLLPATFEHTSNGYYQLKDTEKACGGLSIPALTIATSSYKNTVEAEACSYSIINAIESILNGLGKSMLYRHALVIGSRGNIGHFAMKILSERVTYGDAWGLDLRANSEDGSLSREFTHIHQLPEEAREKLDIFVGLTGRSVLSRDFFERLLMEGPAEDLFFASGSTKTVEFADLTTWIEELSGMTCPEIHGHPVALEKWPVKDPQNGMHLGHRIRITFGEGADTPSALSGRARNIYLLSDVMPINFLYYGVPCEVIDGVFEELYSLLCGFISRHEEGEFYSPGIYAMDMNINKHGLLY